MSLSIMHLFIASSSQFAAHPHLCAVSLCVARRAQARACLSTGTPCDRCFFDLGRACARGGGSLQTPSPHKKGGHRLLTVPLGVGDTITCSRGLPKPPQPQESTNHLPPFNPPPPFSPFFLMCQQLYPTAQQLIYIASEEIENMMKSALWIPPDGKIHNVYTTRLVVRFAQLHICVEEHPNLEGDTMC